MTNTFSDAGAATVIQDDSKAFREEANGLLSAARSIVVTGPEDYQRAGAFFAQIKAKIKEVEAERTKRVKPLNDTVKLINQDFKNITDQLEQVLKVVEAPMLAFKREEERIRREAEEAARREKAKLEAEAKAKAEEEMRKAREAREAEEAARRAAETAQNPIQAYIAKQQAEAAQAAQQEAYEQAQNAIREAAMAQTVVVAPKTTAAGTSFRKTWKFRVVDINAVPREFMIPDEQRLGQIAREQKEAAAIPGIEFYAVESIGGR